MTRLPFVPRRKRRHKGREMRRFFIPPPAQPKVVPRTFDPLQRITRCHLRATRRDGGGSRRNGNVSKEYSKLCSSASFSSSSSPLSIHSFRWFGSMSSSSNRIMETSNRVNDSQNIKEPQNSANQRRVSESNE